MICWRCPNAICPSLFRSGRDSRRQEYHGADGDASQGGETRVVTGGVIVLPVVAFFGAPVILDVPGIGYVDVPEDEYARLYDKLSSPDPDQIDAALATLRKIKAVEDEAVEAAQRRPPDDLLPPPERDLSEPISFGSRFSTTGVPRRGRRSPGLY